MHYQFILSANFFIIKLSGSPRVNERVLIREFILDRHRAHPQQVIIDLTDMPEENRIFILGILHLLKKEVQIKGGELKLCCLQPNLYRQFKKNRGDKIFDIFSSIDAAQRCFRR